MQILPCAVTCSVQNLPGLVSSYETRNATAGGAANPRVRPRVRGEPHPLAAGCGWCSQSTTLLRFSGGPIGCQSGGPIRLAAPPGFNIVVRLVSLPPSRGHQPSPVTSPSLSLHATRAFFRNPRGLGCGLAFVVSPISQALQGYLAHKKRCPPKTLQ